MRIIAFTAAVVVPMNFYMAGLSTAASSDPPRLDPSCAEVNLAYQRTRSYPRYTVELSLIKTDGTIKKHIEVRVTENEIGVKYVFQDSWKHDPRPAVELVDVVGPKFTQCRKHSVESDPNSSTTRFGVRWNSFSASIQSDVYISNDTGLIREVTRHYPTDRPVFSEPTVREVFTYDELN